MTTGWVDIHCHLLPGIDDGAKDEVAALAMARMAVDQGTATVIATPHQLGNFRVNRGEAIRAQVNELQQTLNTNAIPLVVLPGADVRIEDDMIALIAEGDVLTLGDHGKHVLLELPHEIYFPLEPVLSELRRQGIAGVLSHPERNRGLLRQPELLEPLVDAGCLMQVTTGSLTGSFGPESQRLAERMVAKGLVHFLATDAHGPKSRRPLFHEAYERTCQLAGEAAAVAMCRENPRLVAEGRQVTAGRMEVERPKRDWRFWKRAG